uniref:Uncharacterized protein n=1 Tax=Palpitomonas bilix TaxID=652834 RepID=A0A7S3G8G8_9EUKA|mmetsp:Transcript_28131/g.71710  ORF Transcript_28131/g.71710 Transcript_28131/m.71710 type:complete len:309 (+) Transcript_28131:159-1085(+)
METQFNKYSARQLEDLVMRAASSDERAVKEVGAICIRLCTLMKHMSLNEIRTKFPRVTIFMSSVLKQLHAIPDGIVLDVFRMLKYLACPTKYTVDKDDCDSNGLHASGLPWVGAVLHAIRSRVWGQHFQVDAFLSCVGQPYPYDMLIDSIIPVLEEVGSSVGAATDGEGEAESSRSQLATCAAAEDRTTGSEIRDSTSKPAISCSLLASPTSEVTDCHCIKMELLQMVDLGIQAKLSQSGSSNIAREGCSNPEVLSSMQSERRRRVIGKIRQLRCIAAKKRAEKRAHSTMRAFLPSLPCDIQLDTEIK